MKKYLLILLLLTTYCSPVRNRGYEQYDNDQSENTFEYKYAEGDTLSDEEFFGEDEKSDNDMSSYQDDMDPRLKERLRQRGELDSEFENFYEDEDPDVRQKSIDEFYTPKGFLDTTYISIAKNNIMQDGYDALDIDEVFRSGKVFYENEYYDKAAKRFNYIKETALKNDSIYNSSLYYLAETHIAKNRFSDALIELQLILKSNIKNEIRERSLVRVGQIYCVLNLKDKAQKTFDQFKEEYPESIYSSVANCSSIGN